MNKDSPTILVVEDDTFLQDLLSQKLQDESITAQYAADGERALEMASEIHPALIVLDIILPNKDGFAVLKELKSEETLRSIPVIMLSNLGQEEHIEKAQSLGADDYLIKANLDLNEIIATIKNYLKNG